MMDDNESYSQHDNLGMSSGMIQTPGMIQVPGMVGIPGVSSPKSLTVYVFSKASSLLEEKAED